MLTSDEEQYETPSITEYSQQNVPGGRHLEKAKLPSPPGSSRASTASPTLCACDHAGHVLVPLRTIAGVAKAAKGSKQERCVICNKDTSWVCATCTNGPQSLVPVCPETTKGRGKHAGVVTHHSCLDKHRCHPCIFPKGKAPRAKRARGPESE